MQRLPSPAPLLLALLALAALLHADVAQVLEDFGAFVAPALVQLYGNLLEPDWGTIEIVEHSSKTIHKALAANDDAMEPPDISCVRKSANMLVVNYESPRRWCAFAVGLIRGLAKHFDETVIVNEVTCGRTAGSRCQFIIRRAR